MKHNDISYMTIPELLEVIRRLADEIELRFMQEAGTNIVENDKTSGETYPDVLCMGNNRREP